MPVERSPVKDLTQEMENKIVYPSGKLAAITRKKNEISNLISSEDADIDLIKQLFSEFQEKVQNFDEASLPFLRGEEEPTEEDVRFLSWYTEHSGEAEKFRLTVNEWLNKKTEVGPNDSVSQISSVAKSSRSGRSSVASRRSSLKIKLAEIRSKRLAQESIQQEERLLEEKYEEQRRQQEESQRKKHKLFLQQKEDLSNKKMFLQEQNLEKEIEQLENERSQIGSVKSKTSRKELNVHKFVKDDQMQSKSFDNKHRIIDLKSKSEVGRSISVSCEDSSFPQMTNSQLTDVLSKQNEISLMLLKSQERAYLPKHTPDNFDGSDVTKYKSFIQTFESIIENRCENDVDRLFYLEKYTSGLPLQLVRACRNKDASLGYRDAREALEKEYGDQYRIANAYLEKIDNFHVIKSEDGKSLQELSIFLFGCKKMMEDVSPLNQLNSPVEIMKIIGKLPYRMKEGWRRFTLGLKEKNKPVLFADLCKFVQRESDLLNQPIFGKIADPKDYRKEENQKKTNSNHRKKIFATSIVKDSFSQSSNNQCIVCKKTNHQIKTCFFFKRKNYDEKIKFIKDNKICFGCLSSTSHMSKDCPDRLKCGTCSGNHATILHRERKLDKKEDSEIASIPPQNKDDKIEETSKESLIACATKSGSSDTQTGAGKRIVCPSIPVKVRALGSSKMVITYMGLDPCCNDVFMSSSLLKQLGLKGRECNVTLTTMQEQQVKTSTMIVNNLEIYDLNENERSLIPVVYCNTTNWPFERSDVPSIDDLSGLTYLDNVPFQFVDADIGLLVGLNQPNIMKPIQIIDGPNEDQPYATLHKHGYALNGPVNHENTKSFHCFKTKLCHSSDLDAQYKSLCEQEFKDEDPEFQCPSIQDKKWENKVRSSFKRRSDGHFEVELPFKDNFSSFPSNKNQVLNRLMSSKKRMKDSNDYYNEYKSFMDLMFQNNFAERVPIDQLKTAPGKSWYLVHFGVVHKQKKKLRVVFDASLKCQGVSLNDMLMQGPDLTNSLLGVLLRFREEKVAFMADIRKMFYQVKVPDHHRDYLRFFWFPDGDLNLFPVEYRVSVHIFGAISSPAIANFTLRELTKVKETEEFDKDIKETILQNFYVDDLVKSTKDDNDAIRILTEVCNLIAHGGFELTGFTSNSRKVLRSVPLEDLTKDFKNLDLFEDELPHERALGVYWNIEDDAIGINLKLPDKECTRRGVLSTIFSFYDPFGIASPVILLAKRIFQETCYAGLHWDDPLPMMLQESWKEWLKKIYVLLEYRIPRCFKLKYDVTSSQLHLFCDGSETAYAAVAYLRYADDNERAICSSFVMSKTRLVPLKGSALATIPRIELNGAKLAVQLQQIVTRQLGFTVNKMFFWTDSTTVLKYINCESRRLQRFVCNRVTFIRAHTDIESWRHIPGTLNPADTASRGEFADRFFNNKQWKFGPEFLLRSEDEWPKVVIKGSIQHDDAELKKEKKVRTTKLENLKPTDRLLRSSSSWFRTLKKVAWFLRLKHGLRTGHWKNNDLQQSELRLSEEVIWLYVQSEEFSYEIEQLRSKNVLPKKNRLIKLHPFIDERGILRVGGRISRAVASYGTKHPIILQKDHHLVRLLSQKIHKEVGHLGREMLLSEIRRSYWIIGANSLARKISRECLLCRKQLGKPILQIMGDLPEDRMASNIPPFSHTGLDCFGPFMVARGRTREKRYGVIFTCLSSRAIHLEIVFSLESDSFINALRRFTARRGLPKLIRSDNGTNFVGAEKELRLSIEAYNSQQMKDWLLQKGIEWRFQPPAASHFGGVWEREIRSVRKVLGALMNVQQIRLHDEELLTLMCEVESILNARPLTAISNDPDDMEALTPNHILLYRSEVTFPPGLFSSDDLYVRKRWRQVQYLSELFWTRWRKEFLVLLQKRQIWSSEEKSCEVNDLVLLVDQLLPRNQWSLGRIVNTYPDEQGRVRVADVKIARVKGELKPGGQTVIVKRPISKLISLMSAEKL